MRKTDTSGGFLSWIKRSVWVIVGLAVFLLILARLGIRDTVFALKNVHGGYLLIGLFITVVAQQVIPLLKWAIMCRRIDMPLTLRRMLFLSSSVIVGGTISPGRTGEFLPALFVTDIQGKLSSVILFNRVIDSSITFLLAVFLFGLFFKGFLDPRSWLTIGVVLATFLVGVYVLATKESVGIYVLSRGKRLLLRMERVPLFRRILNLEERIVSEISHFYGSMKNLFTWQTVSILVLIALFFWSLMVAANWAFFMSVGQDVPLRIIFATIILAAIASFISPTPGGIGFGDIPPVYFLYLHGYQEGVGAFLLVGRVAVYVAAFGWYLFSASLYGKGGSEEEEAT